jgi:hypothetical protein
VNTAELRKIAEAATSGPWWTSHVGATAGETIRRQVGNQPVAHLSPDDRDSLGIPGAEGAERARRAIAQTTADAAHIATFDPPTILALLDVVEAAERLQPRHGDGCPICAALARLGEAVSAE